MALGNEIIVSANPKGVFLEGIIDGTPKPGTCMQIKAATEMVTGRFTWEVFNQAADGSRSLVAVLLPNSLEGMLATEAYVTGTRGFLYCPAAGEELNMLIGDVAGTGATSDFAIGDRLMIDDTTGKLVDNSSGESVPFVLLETITDLAADYLAYCMYTGH
jgi:hypothetical protein